MEAKLNLLTRLELRSLCSKKLLGIPIDSVIKGKRTQFSKKELISKILEKGDSTIQSAIDKKKHDPGAFLADDTIASDDESVIIKSPIKDLVDKVTERRKQDIATKTGEEATKSFGKQYFKKWQKASEYKKMTKKELLELIDKQNDSEKNY